MVDIWGSIKNTVESVGGAAIAPAGVVYDIASMPLDDKDDDFGSFVSALASHASRVADPLVNPQTLTGGALSGALAGMNWAWREGVSEPAATATMVGRSTFGGLANLGVAGMIASAATGRADLSKLFDHQTWAEAYKRANQQENALGAAFAYGALNPTSDPLAVENPYEEAQREHGAWATGLGWGGEITGMFAGDPTFLALKGVGAVRGVRSYAKLSNSDKANLYARSIDKQAKAGLLKPNLASRTDKYLDWIGGKNSTGRALTGPEILHGTPELRRYASEPHVIAGLLADANKITGLKARQGAQRRILAVAAGDTSQIQRLRIESSETASIADALTNMARQATVDLRLLGAAPNLRTDPRFVAQLESQLKNLNKDGSVDKFIDDWNGRLNQLLDTQHTLPNLPGVHTEGKRALNRLNDTGAARAPKNVLDDWSARLATQRESASTVFQKGLYSVPLVAVKTVGLGASPWTKAPVAVSDALRQTHFTGIASLHDWGGATTQLDSMMRLSEVSPGDRMKLLSEAYLAKSEPERMRAIERIEAHSVKSLASWASARNKSMISPAYITKLLEEGAAKRNTSLASLRGRAYAATEMPPEMAARMQSASRAEDAVRGTESTGWSANAQGKWRLDQINDDGTPLALPVLESQLANNVPLLDVDLAKKMLSRNTGYLARLSRSWEREAKDLERLLDLQAKSGKGPYLNRAIAARAAAADWLVQAGQQAMKVWKFSVLFRLGYPMRVLTDDHLRIWSTIGASSFYGPNSKEFAANLKFNAFDRRVAGRAAIHEARVRKQEILDELDGDHMVSHLARQDELKRLQGGVTARQKKVAALRQQVADAETKHSLGVQVDNLAALQKKLKDAEGDLAEREAAQSYLLEQLGDYSPDDLKTELTGLEEIIALGAKGQRPAKRGLGEADVVLDDGTTVPGAFAGEFGSVMRAASSSGGTFDNLLQGAEERSYRAMSTGSHRTIAPTEAGHLTAWADVLNNQIRTSPAAMHFLEGGSVDEFVRWVKKPEQADLRRRLAHFAYDPEDWGHRISGILHDYIPSDDLRQALLKGRVSEGQLRKMLTEDMRPAVHGRAVADNLGISAGSLGVGRAMHRVYRMLGELPTDHLSRHPFFNSLYKMHVRDVHAVKRAGGQSAFTEADIQEISATARKLALKDLKSTLFDLSAHSHAAHVMRFLSPFFGAHQEGVARWWRIAADNPQIIRRFTQAFDVPRALHIEVDENGDLVEPGAPISRNHRILLQLPQAFGGKDPEKVQSKWSINENAFNVVLQGGLTNPGVGPLVSVPMEWAVEKYADDPAIARVARVFNPYPPNSPMEGVMPATLKRLSAWTYGKTGVDPSLGLGIGKREYNAAFGQNVQDLMVDFQLEHGREPTANEAEALVERAGAETTTMMLHRVLWNSLSPAPAQPRSKYAVIQNGWYKISEQARAEGRDFDWAYAQFKEKYGEAYMPLVYSTSNNPAWVDANAASVAALKQYKGVLNKVDPALTRMVVGAYADDLIESNATLGEYSTDARNYLRDQAIKPGSSETYYSYDEPRQAAEEQMARRGWAKYGELTAALTAQAQTMGLNSYEESEQLVALKRAGIEQIKAENYAFAKDYDTFDTGQYERYLADMRDIVASPSLANDTERTDIQTLSMYLKLRDFFTQVFEQREALGYGGVDSQNQEQVRQAYTALVGRLVESNTYFESHMYNGVIERDPYLVREAA